MLKLGYASALKNESSRLFADLQRNFPEVKSLLVTGCEGGEGVTSLCISLARAAQRLCNAKVLLVDANFRTSGLSQLVGAENAKGLRDLRADSGAGDNVAQTALSFVQPFETDVSVLPRGQSPEVEMMDLESSGALDLFQSAAHMHFDYVIWDTDTINTSTDAKVLMTRVPDVILVTESDATRIDHFASSLNEIAALRARPIAVLRNRAGRRLLSVGADQQ